MLITDKYQDTDYPMRVSCNVMMNLKMDMRMTMIALICKQSETLINPKEDKGICSNFDSGPHADSNYFRWELMTLINNPYQDTDWPIRVVFNVMMNLKWDEVMTRIGMVCK